MFQGSIFNFYKVLTHVKMLLRSGGLLIDQGAHTCFSFSDWCLNPLNA